MRTPYRITTALAWAWTLASFTHAQMGTTAPVAAPSVLPVVTPTLLPVAAPTKAPAAAVVPTKAPAAAVVPTKAPAATATIAPVAVATTAPVAVATTAPVVVASAAPSAAAVNVTTAPVAVASAAPLAAVASQAPSSAPVMVPSALPTGNTSPAPSVVPTDSPSAMPSGIPTKAPTATSAPTAVATESPTMGPTVAATTGTPLRVAFQGIQLVLPGVITLNQGAQADFATVTDQFYEDFYKLTESSQRQRALQTFQSAGIAGLRSTTTFRTQMVTSDNSGPTNTIEYDQLLEYRVIDSNPLSPPDLIVAPFLLSDINRNYTDRLRESNSAFSTIQDGGLDPPVVPVNGDGGGDDGLSTGIIAGIAIGAAVVAGILGYICYSCMNRESNDEYVPSSSPTPQAFSIANSEEVSTLHDPIRTVGSGGGYGDQSVATVDYDYSKAYGGVGDASVVSSAGGTLGENTRLTKDETTTGTLSRAALGAGYDSEAQYDRDDSVREEIIEVVAPSGKLGVVIDTPDDGAPVVHAVKDSSVIAHQIKVGDKLIAVDDQDVTAMTAIKVSKLISKKSANPTRKLTIIRSSLYDDH
jgi:hypothetical protein